MLIIRAVLLVLLMWGLINGIRGLVGTQRNTAENLSKVIADGKFEDWSKLQVLPTNAEAKGRHKQITRIADLFNTLDFAEREKAREQRIGEDFFRRLAQHEKDQFINLTLEESMKTFIRAIDALDPEQRRKFVEDGLREIAAGRTEQEMRRTRAMSEDLLRKIADEGLKSYFENASADTKLDLAPLIEAMDDMMKGLRGREFGPPN